MAECRSCKAPILWAYTQKGKRMPLDAEPVADGNMEIIGREHRPNPDDPPAPLVRVLVGEEQTLPGFDTAPRYRSHFASCPNSAKHRKAAA